MHRFYLPYNQWTSGSLTLSGSEATHAMEVLRLGKEDRLVVFDGKGREATATILDTAKHTLTLSPLVQAKTARPSCAVTLAQAIPKGKNMDFIIQKAVELGASTIIPLLSDRTIKRNDQAEADKKQEKWQRIAIEACKQCGQNWLPNVLSPQTLIDFFVEPQKSELRLIASLQSDARKLKIVLDEFVKTSGRRPKSVTILVGPEGDFTPAEIALAKSHDARPITLGPIILRTETAAIYSLSVLSHELFV